MKQDTQHVFIVGAKSLGAYGGYETFVNKLTEYHRHCPTIKYHIACKANGDGAMDETRLSCVADVEKDRKGQTVSFTYHNAHCFKLRLPDIGPAQAVLYDLAALWKCCRYIEEHQIPHPIVYILACRIGFFAPFFHRWIRRLGGKLLVNPDGHEWMRTKWNRLIRKYWKYSEEVMVCHCDLAVCDSVNIEKYIHSSYDGKCPQGTDPKTTYIAYGAELADSIPVTDALEEWFRGNGIRPKDYYLIVGRFVPENNYETMIREFSASDSSRNLVIVTNTNPKFQQELDAKLHYSNDPRIRFVGSVYDQQLLSGIRANAYAYLHGHEVGGTNPSLLEALGATELNLLLDVPFNREVAEDAALYWTKDERTLADLIARCDRMAAEDIRVYGQLAKKRVAERYSWQYIADQYRRLFCGETDTDHQN